MLISLYIPFGYIKNNMHNTLNVFQISIETISKYCQVIAFKTKSNLYFREIYYTYLVIEYR